MVEPMRGRSEMPEGFWLLLFVYRLLAPFLFLGLLPGALLRAYRRGGGRGRWGERLGRFDLAPEETIEGCVWVRSISVGETLVALRFVEALRQSGWDGPVVLTATTATGVGVAEPRAGDSDALGECAPLTAVGGAVCVCSRVARAIVCGV
jgi:3-deoxy-D-manno-octulosonic-acid transferase